VKGVVLCWLCWGELTVGFKKKGVFLVGDGLCSGQVMKGGLRLMKGWLPWVMG